MDRADFTKLSSYIKKNYGIDLTAKEKLIVGRLSVPILEMGFTSFNQYVEHITTSKKQSDIDFMLDKLTTNFTYFMRENSHFEYIMSTVLPQLEKTKKDKVLGIWSAGCSYGHEPYTLAICMHEYFGSRISEWDTRILATDISTQALNHAQQGIYTSDSLGSLPAEWLSKYFQPVGNDGSYSVKDNIKKTVIYRQFNLMEPILFKTKFDFIMCRNVMIYFDRETKKALTDRFYDATNPDGYLFIGHSENLTDIQTRYKSVSYSTYKK